MVLICTRMAEDDLPGRLIRSDPAWVVLWHPALTEEEETYWDREVIRGMPMGVSTEALLDKRARDPRAFRTQYQAQPPSAEGHVFRSFASMPMPHPSDVRAVYQFYDTAQTAQAKKKGSYSVMVEGLHLKNGQLFISLVWRERIDPAMLFDKIVENFHAAKERWGMSPLVRVENKASGASVAGFLRRYSDIAAFVDVAEIPGSKGHRGQAALEERAAPAAKVVDSRMLVLPYDADCGPWKEEYVMEMSAFPDGEYRDQVAATLLLIERVFPMVAGGNPPNLSIRMPGWNRRAYARR